MKNDRQSKMALGTLLVIMSLSCSLGNEKLAPPSGRAGGISAREIGLAASGMNPDNPRLPGSGKGLADALKAADLIVIARITRVAPPSGDAAGESSYSPVEIQVERAIRGDASGKLKISINVRTFPGDKAEVPPKVGDRLLFLLTRKSLEAVKILYPTDKNIAACS